MCRVCWNVADIEISTVIATSQREIEKMVEQ